MPIEEILEVAVGLIFMWLILSISTMQVQEWMVTRLRWRADDLEKAIRQMLLDHNLANEVYNHPLIRSMMKAPKPGDKKDPKPSYIPAEKFGLVLFDTVASAGTDKSKILEDLDISKLRAGVKKLSETNADLAKAINTLLVGVENTDNAVAAARDNFEKWFNDVMDRAGGWYKRRAQGVAFLIGLILAIVLNIDSIAVANFLWREPSVRQALAARATAFQPPEQTSESNPALAIQEFRDQFDGLQIPFGWTFQEVDLTPKNPEDKSLVCSFLPSSDQQVFGFGNRARCIRPTTAQASTNGIVWSVAKILGILMTAGAAAQGAPFWFDMLAKFTNVRGSGVKPSKTREEDKDQSP
jgi:hypothetical protein